MPAIAWAVDPDEDRLGWRLTVGIIAAVVLASAFIIPRLIRNRPQDYDLLPDGTHPDAPRETNLRPERFPAGSTSYRQREQEFTTSQALRTPAFWFITFGHGFGSMVIIAVFTHLGLLMVKDE